MGREARRRRAAPEFLLVPGGWKTLSDTLKGGGMNGSSPQHQVPAGIPRDAVPRVATVVCSRVANYSQFVCGAPPAEVQSVVTAYVTAMATIVRASGGFVNRSSGGEIVAVYGYPLEEESHAHRAVVGAREMLVTMHELNARWGISGLPQLDGIGVGVDTGLLRLIRIKAGKRVRLDAIGAPMTGATRLQELTTEMGHPLIMSSEVARDQRVFPVAEEGAATSHGADALEFVGEVMLRGQGRRRLFGLHEPKAPAAFAHTRSRPR